METMTLKAERTYYRDMWLAQRVENENYRKQLGLVPVSDEAERELEPYPATDDALGQARGGVEIVFGLPPEISNITEIK